MANYQLDQTGAEVQAILDAVQDKETTRPVLNSSKLITSGAVRNALDEGYLYAGVAHPGDAAVTPDANVFYIATEPGTYTNFVGAGGSLVVADGEVAIFKFNGQWSKETTGAATAAQVNQLGQEIDRRMDAQDAEIDRRMDAQDGRLDGQDARLDGQDEEIADFKEAVQNQVDNYPMITINGNVTNAPDEEDLTSVEENGNDVLKFKNRSAVDGMGYVILRKGGSNTFANQVTAANTIYEIRYAFDLGGESVTIPSGCVLKFNGGSISNGTLNLNGGVIDAPEELIFNSIVLQNVGNDVFNGRWIFVDNQVVTASQFAALPEIAIDFCGLTLNSTEALSCKSADWRNLNIEAPRIVVSAGEPDGQIKCYKPASLISSQGIKTAISIIENNIGDLTGKIICIKCGKHVAFDWREDATTHLPTLFKGITSYVNMYDADNNIAALDDFIEPFDSSYLYEDSLGGTHTIESVATIITPTHVHFDNCKFVSNDNTLNFVTLVGAHNGLIENCIFDTKNKAGNPCLLGIGQSLGIIVSNCIVSNAVYPNTGTSYGVQVGESTRVQVVKSKFFGNRRGVDFSGIFESRYGEVSHCQIYGSNEIINGEGQSLGSCIGSHSTSYMNAFRYNTLVGQSSRTGIQLRGECEIVEGNLIYGPFNAAAISASYKSVIRKNYFDNGIPGSTFAWAEEVSDDNHIIVADNVVKNIWCFVRCGGTLGEYTIVGNDVSFGVNNSVIFPKANIFACGNKFSGISMDTAFVAKNITPDTLILENNKVQVPIILDAKGYGAYGSSPESLTNINASGTLVIDTNNEGVVRLIADIEVSGSNYVNYIGFSPKVGAIDYGDFVLESEYVPKEIVASYTYGGQKYNDAGIYVCVKDGIIYVSRDVFIRFPEDRKYHIVAELTKPRKKEERNVCISARNTDASNRRMFIPLELWTQDPAYIADGVAIIDKGRILTIAAVGTSAKYASADNIVSGVTYSTDRNQAIEFSDGKGATIAMAAADPTPQTYAPYLAQAYASANIHAGAWYIPTLNDWMLIARNIVNINIGLRLIGGSEISSLPHYTSVEKDAKYNWIFSPMQFYAYQGNKTSTLPVRFVTEYAND